MASLSMPNGTDRFQSEALTDARPAQAFDVAVVVVTVQGRIIGAKPVDAEIGLELLEVRNVRAGLVHLSHEAQAGNQRTVGALEIAVLADNPAPDFRRLLVLAGQEQGDAVGGSDVEGGRVLPDFA